MSLMNFIAELQATECGDNSSKMLDYLKEINFDPEIYWYPGSGNDMSPLLFDVPNNPTGRRLLRMREQINEKTPILLWMNDYAESLNDFPSEKQLNSEIKSDYNKLWSLYKTKGSFGAYKEACSLGSMEFTLFSVNIKNVDQGLHSRPPQGDDYIVLFSHLKSEDLLKDVFLKYEIHINTVALIKQGGFSGQTIGHYEQLPTMLKEQQKKIGLIDYWIIDSQGVDSKGSPVCNDLAEYEYIGGPVPWGWNMARIYGRKSIQYKREKRPFRIGKSWSFL